MDVILPDSWFLFDLCKGLTSKQGDTLDLVCYKYYQQQTDIIEQVLAVNQHLVDLQLILPVGTIINLPLITKKQTQKTVVLW